jgi:hypothetical protein
MSNDELLTPGNSHTMMSPEAQAKVQEIHESQSIVSENPVAQSTENTSSQTVPTDEPSIVLGLIEYLRRGAEFSGENQSQAEWFTFCSNWVKQKYEESNLSR